VEYIDVLKYRKTTFAWDYDRPLDESVFDNLFNEIYDHIPTKNLMFPYQVNLIKNDNEERRKEIMTICHRNLSYVVEKDPGNPQVLAPYLIGIGQRDVKDLEVRYDPIYRRPPESVTKSDYLEIGILCSFIMLGLSNRGVNTGICQNACNNPDRIGQLLGVDYPIGILIGVGYAKGDGWHEYIDPRVDKVRKVPYPTENVADIYGKPDFEKIFVRRV
jgi:hypothetical protein